jgi:acetyl esterase/lipase
MLDARRCRSARRRSPLARLVAQLALVALLLLALPAAAGAASQKGVNVKYNIAYGGLALQNMDIYPAATPSAPLVVLVHGGGWKTNDKKTVALQAASLQAAGFAVFNVNYRLDSKHVGAFPMEVEDVEAATRFSIANGVSYNGNPANVILVAGSAAGQLIALATQSLNSASAGTVKALVTLSGPFYFPTLVTEDREGSLDPHFSKSIPQALGCSLKTTCSTPEQEAWAIKWSPSSQVTSAGCPAAWLMFNSEHELMPLNQPEAMKATLEAQGCAVSEQIVPGTTHSFGYWPTVRSNVVSFIASQ